MLSLLCLLLASLGCLGFGPPVLTDGGYPLTRLYPEEIESISRLAHPPEVSATAALMVDVDAGQTLAAKNEHAKLRPASTAKLMTALLVMQRGKLTDRVTVSANAAATEGSRMGLQTGETLTVRDLLHGLLIPSGNDAAVALAEYVAGSEAGFVKLMNEAAAQMQLRETHYANSHGLDDPQQTISAADLLAVAQAVLSYPDLATIVATRQEEIAGHALVNTNQLLGVYPGADGVKTGTTDEAGECLVASVTRMGHRLMLVILQSDDRYADARSLLGFAAEGWSWRPVALDGGALDWLTDADGHRYRLRPAEDADLFLPAWEWPLVHPVRVFDTGRPLSGILPVGDLRLELDGATLASVPLTVYRGP